MNNGPRIFDDAPDHVCHIDCKLGVDLGAGRVVHMMYAAEPNTAAGRYQYDENRKILHMGKGARAAMRATGQQDTRANREWNYGRKLWNRAKSLRMAGAEPALSDALYRKRANETFGPDRRPYVKRRLRETARLRAQGLSPEQAASDRLTANLSAYGQNGFREVEDKLKESFAPLYSSQAGLASYGGLNIHRPSYLPGSEHDPNL